jgi:hypothetical protein
MPTPDSTPDLPPGTAPPEPPPPSAEDEDAARVLLGKLNKVAAPPDLATRVPDLIQRRSAGRFFTKRRIADRLPLEWVSLVMLAVLALIYAVLRMAPALFGGN